MTGAMEERILSRSWSGEGVDLGRVAAELIRLHEELTRPQSGQLEHPHPRNCVMNLVVAVGDERREATVQRAAQALAAGHPLRAVVVHRTSRAGEGIDAEITTESHRLVRGRSVQMERVTIRVRGQAAEHTASLVEPLMVPDVPRYLWWTGTPPLTQHGLREALAACDVLIVDSAHFANVVEAFLDLAALAERLGKRLGFIDLQWARQRPWRETLSQFFSPLRRRDMLGGLERVVVESVGMGPAGRVGAALLGGWLMSALDWRMTEATRSSPAGAEVLLRTPQRKTVELALRAVEHEGLPHGALRALGFDGRVGAMQFAARMEIRPDRTDHAHVRIDIGGQETLHQRLPLPQLTEPDLLVTALSAAHLDRVYLRSLDAAAKLVDALR
jgi:glucose-6-phosphate dehydrogenase assembly protein OpcA